PFSGSRENDQVLAEKLRLVSYDRALQVNCARKWTPTLARHENHFVWVFVRGDERAEKIRWNAPPASANARRSPGDCFVQNIFLARRVAAFAVWATRVVPPASRATTTVNAGLG